MESIITSNVSFSKTKRPSLREELSALGLGTLNKKDVRQHQKKILVEQYQFRLTPIISKVTETLWMLSLVPIAQALEKNQKRDTDLVWKIFLSVLAIASVLGFGALFFENIPTVLSLLVTPVVSMLLFILIELSILMLKAEMASELGDSWCSTPFQFFRQGMPTHITKRASIVKNNIEDVQLEIEHFQKDPFLVVARYTFLGLLRESAIVGAWETGVPEFDQL